MGRSARHSARRRERARKAGVRADKRSDARSLRTLTRRGILFMLILAGVLFSSVYPMKRYFAVRASIEALQQEEVSLDRRAASLAKQKQELLTDQAVERMAREQLGMVKVGDVPFVVIEPGASSKPVARPPIADAPEPDEQPASLWSRLWESLRRATRALR